MSFSRLIRLFGETRCVAKGKTVHGKIITSGFEPDVFTNNHLVSMYLKFNLIDDATRVFGQMPQRNLITWSSLISGYSQMGMADAALECVQLMINDGFDLNYYTYVAALSACAALNASIVGKELHGRIYRVELELNNHVSNCLINMYGKCGLLSWARRIFDVSLEPSTVSWTSILSGYCQSGDYAEGLRIFLLSRKAGVVVNEFVCASVLGACAALKELLVGMQVHCLAVKCGIRFDQFVATGLINLYAKCSKLDLANNAFLEVDAPHFSAWTALMGGCVQLGKGREAMNLFHKFHSSGLKPSEMTFSSVLGAFSDTMEVEAGKQIHSLIIRLGFSSVTVVSNAVLDFYSKCGLLEESSKVFEEMDEHDVVSWNTLMSGHVRLGCHEEATELLGRMLFEGFEPNVYTYSTILSSCCDLPAEEWGKQTHCRLIKPGFDSSVVVGSSLVDMYAKCGRLVDARKVFDRLGSKNLVSWNTMLIGYAQHGLGREALEFYALMQKAVIEPSDITFLGVLTACVHIGLVQEGLHHFNSMSKDYGLTPRMDHIACMVNLFARSGQTRRAYEFIKCSHLEPDKIVWRCLLSGCKTHKDLDLGRYAAEQIFKIDQEDTSAYVMLSNIYAEASMWSETAQLRKVMKEKELKKDTGYSWIELQHKTYFFTSEHATHSQGTSLRQVLDGLIGQLFDAGYVTGSISAVPNAEVV